ncbi:MAG: hypothetical protein WBZ36_20455 [Candidatus Nitrosopolaris sp.]
MVILQKISCRRTAAADQDNLSPSDNTGFHGCPGGHTQEYCKGFETGYDTDDDLLDN